MDRDVNVDYVKRPIRDFVGIMKSFYQLFFHNRISMMWSIRQALEKAETYDEAFHMLSTAPIISPVYYIISGTEPGQGAVLTMDREGIYDVAKLDADNGIWYLVQTNYDRDLPDPKDDLRRVPAEKRMDSIGRANIDEGRLFMDVLALYPNNNEETIETVVYSAAKNSFNITLWI